MIEGQGVAKYANGLVYEGGFKRGRNEGQGRMTYPDGYVYNGAWRDGQRHGQGQATIPTARPMTAPSWTGCAMARGG